MKLKIKILLLILILPILIHAQNGSLSGSITDKSNGDPLIGANVFIKGTSKGAATNLDGTYLIKGIKAGVYDIEFTYIGYKKTVQTAIRITAGQNKELSAKLQPTALTIDQEVVIIGEKPLIDLDQSVTEQRISS